MSVANQLLIVRGVTRFINHLSSTVTGIGMKLSGLMKAASLRFGNMTVGDSAHPIYLNDGVPTVCDNLLLYKTYSYRDTKPSGNAILTRSTPSGDVHELNIEGGLYMYTSSASVSTGGMYIYSTFNGGYRNTYLHDKNWTAYIDVGKSVTLNDGTVTFQYNGATIKSFTVNQENSDTLIIPNEVETRALNNNYTSQFRTLTNGTSAISDYLSICSNSVGDAYMPKNAPTVAWGRADTHGYITVNPSKQGAFMGGGNADKLNWRGEIAFKSDIPVIGSYMDANGGLNTTSSLSPLLQGVTKQNDGEATRTGNYSQLHAFGYLDDDDTLLLRGTGGGWWNVPMSYVEDYIAQKRKTYYQTKTSYNNNSLVANNLNYVFNPYETPIFVCNNDNPNNTYAWYDMDMGIYIHEEYTKVVNGVREIKYPIEVNYIMKRLNNSSAPIAYLKLVGAVYYCSSWFHDGVTSRDTLTWDEGSTIAVGDMFMLKMMILPRTSDTAINEIITTVTIL